jgi:hypothetical protein
LDEGASIAGVIETFEKKGWTNAPDAAVAATKNDFEGKTSPEKRRPSQEKAGNGDGSDNLA